MSDPTTPVLFLSGAGLPPWVWDDVRAGLPAHVPSAVAGRPGGTGTSLARYADAAAASSPWPTFAVVAHSSGGVVAAELCARHPGRVTAVLGVAAVVPRPGRSFVASMPLPGRLVLGAALRLAGTRPPERALRTTLTPGLPDAVADRVVQSFVPESPRLFLDRTSPRTLPARRGYVATLQDRELTAAVQRASVAVLDPRWTSTLPTGHLPMLQDPPAVVEAVQRLLAAE